jgi:Glycoside-hydrolase family GH114
MKSRFAVALAAATVGMFAPAAASAAAIYKLPPTGQDQWYWEISPPSNGLAGLPSVTGAYPSPGSANIWDTDMFADSNTDGGVPTGPSPVVQALHAAGKYSICYIEAGVQQPEPDSSNFAPADYTDGSNPETTEMQGWPGEYWYDIRGFANYVAGDPSTLTGAAVNIAAGLAQRIDGCAREGQDALEPDDLDGYTNPSQTGAAGGGWGLTQADSAGFERWLAYTAHSDGLAIFQKNDPANSAVDEPLFDGMIIEECNYYDDPCAGSGGDATPYLDAGKPVLNAEYTQDGETTANFCAGDVAAGITGALFDVNLDGQTYEPCAPVGQTRPGGTGTGGGGGTGGGSTGGGTTSGGLPGVSTSPSAGAQTSGNSGSHGKKKTKKKKKHTRHAVRKVYRHGRRHPKHKKYVKTRSSKSAA